MRKLAWLTLVSMISVSSMALAEGITPLPALGEANVSLDCPQKIFVRCRYDRTGTGRAFAMSMDPAARTGVGFQCGTEDIDSKATCPKRDNISLSTAYCTEVKSCQLERICACEVWPVITVQDTLTLTVTSKGAEKTVLCSSWSGTAVFEAQEGKASAARPPVRIPSQPRIPCIQVFAKWDIDDSLAGDVCRCLMGTR